MALFRGIQEYIALAANNIAPVESRAIYSCIPLKAIQYYISIVCMNHVILLCCVILFTEKSEKNGEKDPQESTEAKGKKYLIYAYNCLNYVTILN